MNGAVRIIQTLSKIHKVIPRKYLYRTRIIRARRLYNFRLIERPTITNHYFHPTRPSRTFRNNELFVTAAARLLDIFRNY